MLIVLVTVQGILVFTGISFNSETAKNVLLEQLIILTQRDAYIDGDVRVTISLLPELIINRIHIENHEGFDEVDFITLSEASVQLSLLSLLTGNIHVTDIAANHAQIGLILKKDGRNNWSLDHLFSMSEQTSEAEAKTVSNSGAKRRVTIDRIALTDVTVRFQDDADNRVVQNHFSTLLLDIEDASKPRAEFTGSLQHYPYAITLESDSLEKLSLREPWKVSGTGSIADRNARVEAVVQLLDNTIVGNIELSVVDINLGLLLEHAGIITGENAAARELNINIILNGVDARQITRDAAIELELKDGYWRWQALLKDEIRELAFDKAVLRTAWKKPVQLNIDGALFGEVIRLELNTNHLSEFFDDIHKLDIDLSVHVAGSEIVLAGTVDLPVRKRLFQLDISLSGTDLEKLNKILNSELPPFNNYSLNGRVSANQKGYIVRADDVSIGDTHFKTSLVIDTSSFKPFWTINLDSRQLQIKDFEFVDLQVDIADAKAISNKLMQDSGELKDEPARRLKQIVNDPIMHFDLNLKVSKVLAGDTALGSSSLRLKLRDKTLIMDDAELSVPGGMIKSSAAFKTLNGEVRGAFKLDIDKFDYGAVARYFDFSFEEGGVISARIDLKLGGRDFSRLFDQATGTLDVALWPRNTQTKLFDFWANSLLLIILPEIKEKEDRINCIVALMNLDDGIMKEDFFGIDTRKVWMHGNIHVDFRNDRLQLSLYPRSKKARLFALQAPIRAEGNFDDIGLTTNPVDLAAAYYSFITSPLHVPARRILDDRVPEDASETCEKFFDRDYVKQLKEKIEQEEQNEIDEWLDSD